MRKIKFRGKNDSIGWVEGQLVYDLNGNAYIINEVEIDYISEMEETVLYPIIWHKVDPETVSQFVGTGEYGEIYENMKLYDLYAGEECSIEYDEEDCGFRIYYEGCSERIEGLDGLQILEENNNG